MQSSISKSGRLVTLLGFLSAVALGCVVTVGKDGKDATECPDPNSYKDNSDGQCYCETFYEWCNPGDDTDLSCCKSATSASGVSVTNDPSDTTGGTTDGTATGGTTDGTATDGTATDTPTTGEPPTTSEGTTGEPLDCSASSTVPESCDPNTENFLCLQADDPVCGPEGSKYYFCDNGTWTQAPDGPNENCVDADWDFSYGCIDDGNMIVFECGNGPGTACSGTATSCNGENELNFCQYGKLGAVDCLFECMQVGDGGGVTYDFGYCGEQRGEAQCICCDEGEDGCPLGGETTGG